MTQTVATVSSASVRKMIRQSRSPTTILRKPCSSPRSGSPTRAPSSSRRTSLARKRSRLPLRTYRSRSSSASDVNSTRIGTYSVDRRAELLPGVAEVGEDVVEGVAGLAGGQDAGGRQGDVEQV